MSIAKEVWFVVADSEHARLLRARPVQHGRLHVDEVDKLATTFAAGEHQRPTRLGQPGHMAPTRNEHDEKLAHFARELTRWLERLVAAHTLTRCPVFAPSHMLGALRKTLDELRRPALTIEEVPRDLVKSTPTKLRDQLEYYGLLPPRRAA